MVPMQKKEVIHQCLDDDASKCCLMQNNKFYNLNTSSTY